MSSPIPPDERTHRIAGTVRAADLWRGAGLGLAVVWAVLLGLVVVFWLRVTFFRQPGDDIEGYAQVVLAPVAVVAAVLLGWTVVSLWSLWMRRERGWDVIVVLGAFAIAGALFLVLPGEFLDRVQERVGPRVVGLAGLGVFSVVVGLLGQRTWRRAAVALDAIRRPRDDGLDVEMWPEDEVGEDAGEYLR